ncbi:MAG: hypothetical protein WBQ69_07895 [Gallionella sp.]
MNIIKSTAYAAMLLASLSAQAAQPIINLSIGGEISPGVYGQVQFGNAPPPPVVYAQPTIIEDHGGRRLAPIYLHVPPEHAKHWAKYCHKYNACNRPVYFVKSREYEPGYHAHKDEGHRDEGHRDDRGDHDHRD